MPGFVLVVLSALLATLIAAATLLARAFVQGSRDWDDRLEERLRDPFGVGTPANEIDPPTAPSPGASAAATPVARSPRRRSSRGLAAPGR